MVVSLNQETGATWRRKHKPCLNFYSCYKSFGYVTERYVLVSDNAGECKKFRHFQEQNPPWQGKFFTLAKRTKWPWQVLTFARG